MIDTMNGLLLVDKPVGITSFDVIRQLRRKTGVRKIGHAGTLDPLASGLMLMLFGTACKQAGLFSKLDKRYVAEVTLGQVSTTYDGEGEKTVISDRVPTQEEVQAALDKLTGELIQYPPVYSAIKIDGKEAYKRARAGEKVEVPPRKVTVYENRLISYEYPIVKFESHVSSGTYVRTLAHDLGKLLETGAYLSGLVRSQVGEYVLSEALELDEANPDRVSGHLL